MKKKYSIFEHEIERKFHVKKLPQDLNSYPHEDIHQGYIVIADEFEIRLRRCANKLYQTVKSGKGLYRKEIEIELTEEQFQKLWPLTEKKRIKKVRYQIEYHRLLIELDIYHASLAGLITAEVEFQSIKMCESFTPPDWFGLEITKDERFKNKNLARFGLPTE